MASWTSHSRPSNPSCPIANADQSIAPFLPDLGEARSKEPEGGTVRDRLGITKEPDEIDLIRSLSFQLLVAEVIQTLKHEHLHNYYIIHVGAASVGSRRSHRGQSQ